MRSRLFVVAAIVGCGGQLTEIPPPPPSAEGGSDVARVDGASNDGESTTDDGALPPGSWCADNFPYGVAMCDDFDLLATPKPEWTTSGSGLVVVESPISSAPHALHVVAAAGTSSFLSFEPQKTAIESKAQAEIWIAADGASTTTSEPAVLALQCDGGQSVGLVIVPGTGNAHCIDTGFAGTSTFTTVPFERNAWHAVVLKISVNQDGTYNPSCVVDGVGQGRTAAANAPLGNMTLVAGVIATTSQAIEAYYDNVADDVMQ